MKPLRILLLLMCMPACVIAQLGISYDQAPADPSAMLEVRATDRGVLMPRMTFTLRNAITSPAEGLMVYCTDCSAEGKGLVSVFQGGSWKNLPLECVVPVSPPAGTHPAGTNQVTWTWSAIPIALGYRWNTTDNFDGAQDVGDSTVFTETGLNCNTAYTRYAWAYNACGFSKVVMTQTTLMTALPAAPQAGVHESTNNRITWNWIPAAGATGYRWSATNNFATATDLGPATARTETGLTCATAYTRYVWAFNPCGNSTATVLTASTVPCYPCNETLIVTHHPASGVAPVEKTTSYSMTGGIPGSQGKCWITGNLGSDRQALAVDDSTEASAGWYWQFNRKQGYKNGGTAAVPAWTVVAISENGDWQPVNDPCSIELGADWRLPTRSEWNSITYAGTWINWNTAWNSALKLHAAGYLGSSTGNLYSRGADGNYWSGSDDEALHATTIAYLLSFSSSSVSLPVGNKANGFSVRCLREL